MSGDISISVIEKGPLPREQPQIMHVSAQTGVHARKKKQKTHTHPRSGGSDRQAPEN